MGDNIFDFISKGKAGWGGGGPGKKAKTPNKTAAQLYTEQMAKRNTAEQIAQNKQHKPVADQIGSAKNPNRGRNAETARWNALAGAYGNGADPQLLAGRTPVATQNRPGNPVGGGSDSGGGNGVSGGGSGGALSSTVAPDFSMPADPFAGYKFDPSQLAGIFDTLIKNTQTNDAKNLGVFDEEKAKVAAAYDAASKDRYTEYQGSRSAADASATGLGVKNPDEIYKDWDENSRKEEEYSNQNKAASISWFDKMKALQGSSDQAFLENVGVMKSGTIADAEKTFMDRAMLREAEREKMRQELEIAAMEYEAAMSGGGSSGGGGGGGGRRGGGSGGSSSGSTSVSETSTVHNPFDMEVYSSLLASNPEAAALYLQAREENSDPTLSSLAKGQEAYNLGIDSKRSKYLDEANKPWNQLQQRTVNTVYGKTKLGKKGNDPKSVASSISNRVLAELLKQQQAKGNKAWDAARVGARVGSGAWGNPNVKVTQTNKGKAK